MATAAQKKKAAEAAAKAAAAADKKAKAEEASADGDTAPAADAAADAEGGGDGEGKGEALQDAHVAPAEPAKASKAAPKAKAGATVSVVAAKGLARFFRCGMRFGPEPVELVVAELEEGVLQRLKDEPRLVVTEED